MYTNIYRQKHLHKADLFMIYSIHYGRRAAFFTVAGSNMYVGGNNDEGGLMGEVGMVRRNRICSAQLHVSFYNVAEG